VESMWRNADNRLVRQIAVLLSSWVAHGDLSLVFTGDAAQLPPPLVQSVEGATFRGAPMVHPVAAAPVMDDLGLASPSDEMREWTDSLQALHSASNDGRRASTTSASQLSFRLNTRPPSLPADSSAAAGRPPLFLFRFQASVGPDGDALSRLPDNVQLQCAHAHVSIPTSVALATAPSPDTRSEHATSATAASTTTTSTTPLSSLYSSSERPASGAKASRPMAPGASSAPRIVMCSGNLANSLAAVEVGFTHKDRDDRLHAEILIHDRLHSGVVGGNTVATASAATAATATVTLYFGSPSLIAFRPERASINTARSHNGNWAFDLTADDQLLLAAASMPPSFEVELQGAFSHLVADDGLPAAQALACHIERMHSDSEDQSTATMAVGDGVGETGTTSTSLSTGSLLVALALSIGCLVGLRTVAHRLELEENRQGPDGPEEEGDDDDERQLPFELPRPSFEDDDKAVEAADAAEAAIARAHEGGSYAGTSRVGGRRAASRVGSPAYSQAEGSQAGSRIMPMQHPMEHEADLPLPRPPTPLRPPVLPRPPTPPRLRPKATSYCHSRDDNDVDDDDLDDDCDDDEEGCDDDSRLELDGSRVGGSRAGGSRVGGSRVGGTSVSIRVQDLSEVGSHAALLSPSTKRPEGEEGTVLLFD